MFREEKKGVDGLQIIKEKTKTPYTLAVDLNNEKTGRYSSKKGEFTGYVIDGTGTITGIFDGNLRNRAKSDAFLTAIEAASGGSSMKEGSSKKAGSDAKAGSDVKAGSGAKAGSSSKAASGSKGSGSK